MKYIYLFSLLILFKTTSAQLPVKDGKVVYEYVDSSSESAAVLHSKAKAWFANAFRDSKEVIQVDEVGTLIGKGNFDFEQAMVPFLIKFSVKVNTKEGKYRIQFYDITYREGRAGATKDLEVLSEKKGRDKLKGNINDQFISLMNSFKKSMGEKDDF